jgi:hypothetical protein
VCTDELNMMDNLFIYASHLSLLLPWSHETCVGASEVCQNSDVSRYYLVCRFLYSTANWFFMFWNLKMAKDSQGTKF